MKPIDIIILLVIVLIVSGAGFYIVWAKRRGQRCIGCPDAKTCSGHCASCQGCLHQEQKKET